MRSGRSFGRSRATIDQAGGLAVRLLDPNNYYVVRANALEGNVRFYKVVDGKREQLAGANLRSHPTMARADPARPGRPVHRHVQRQGIVHGNRPDVPLPGKVAFWTKADSVTRFDTLTIKSLR